MKVIVSKTINGPQIVDGIEGNQTGLDLSGFGIEAGAPGDVVRFPLFIRLQTTPEEDAQFDGVDNFGIYLESASVYTGDYDADTALADILAMGDDNYGLAIQNPETGDYDIRFKNGSYDAIDSRFIVKKENLIWYNTDLDTSNPTQIRSEGFDAAVIDNASSGTTLKTTTSVFKRFMVGAKIWNDSENDFVVIEEYVSATEVKVSKSVNWDGDTVKMYRIETPLDGVIGFGQAAEDYGNVIRLDLEFKIPPEYARIGIKQFAIKFAWFKEPN